MAVYNVSILRKHVGPDLEQHLWYDDPVSWETQPGCDRRNGQTSECDQTCLYATEVTEQD